MNITYVQNLKIYKKMKIMNRLLRKYIKFYIYCCNFCAFHLHKKLILVTKSKGLMNVAIYKFHLYHEMANFFSCKNFTTRLYYIYIYYNT